MPPPTVNATRDYYTIVFGYNTMITLESFHFVTKAKCKDNSVLTELLPVFSIVGSLSQENTCSALTCKEQKLPIPSLRREKLKISDYSWTSKRTGVKKQPLQSLQGWT